MRRRQRLAQLREEGVLDKSPYVLMAKGINPNPPRVKRKARVKGECPKCGEHIGLGVHMHTSNCYGRLEEVQDYKKRQIIEETRSKEISRRQSRRASLARGTMKERVAKIVKDWEQRDAGSSE